VSCAESSCAECPYAECPYVECPYAECPCPHAGCPYAECPYTERPYAERPYVECHGVLLGGKISNVYNQISRLFANFLCIFNNIFQSSSISSKQVFCGLTFKKFR